MKLKKIIMAALLFSLSASTQAETMTVGQSGIDWKNSVLTVVKFEASHPSHKEAFRCFGSNYEKLPISQNLYALGFENRDKGPLTLTQTLEDSACFQQAGAYSLEIDLKDYAGNQSEYETILTVVPSDLNLEASTLEPVASRTSGGSKGIADLTNRLNCTSTTLVADGNDQCVLEVNLRDRFANVIKPDGINGNLSLTLPTEGVAKSLDASENFYGAFLKGLYFENNQKDFVFSFPSNKEQLQVGVKSFVPTLERTKSKEVGKAQAQVEPQPVRFDLAYRLAKNSDPESTSIKTVQPLFSPWVKLVAKAQGSLENFVLLPLNRPVQVPLELTSLVEKPLPGKLTLDWVSPQLKTLWVRFTDSKLEEKTHYKSLVAVDQTPQPLALNMSLFVPEGTTPKESFALEPIVTYSQKIEGKNQLVRYPLSILGGVKNELIPPFEGLSLKAAVEGRLLTDGTSNAENLVLSGTDRLQFSGWRERVNREAISLIRGQSPRSEEVFNVDKDWGDSNVAYFKGKTVRLTSDGKKDRPIVFNKGVKTLIIEDGNLHLTRDLVYGSTEDSLGIIVINTKPNDAIRGHVFIHQNVQRMVGSYFLDGALVSTQKLNDPSVTDVIENREDTGNQDASAILALQLVLEGTVVSRNTMGGADMSPAQGPNGQNLQRELALIYDLNYLRRYEPLFQDTGKRLPDNLNNYCTKLDGKNCYKNPAPTVIAYDARVQALTPPGFGDQ